MFPREDELCLWEVALVVVFLAFNFPGSPKGYLLQSPGISEEACYICKVIPAGKSHSRLRWCLAHPGDGHVSHSIQHLSCRRENYEDPRHSPPKEE